MTLSRCVRCFREYTDRLGAVFESFPSEQEQACFEQKVWQMEEDLNEMKIRVNTWARGDINEFRYDEFSNVPLAEDGLLSKLKAKGYEVREP